MDSIWQQAVRKKKSLGFSFRILVPRIKYWRRDRRLIESYLESERTKKLQVGSGANALAGWLNSDIQARKDIIYLNATKRFSFHDNVFDYIFAEHLIEHLTYMEGRKFLGECYRILKPSGKIRLATPDLQFLLALYSKRTSLHAKYIRWATAKFMPYLEVNEPAFVINNFFRDWGHKSIYDYESIKGILQRTGFINVVQQKVRESSDDNLCKVESHGKAITEEFNELETMVVEAEKPGITSSFNQMII
jgi:predicted SAM-dependent methyltransferase